MRARHLSGSTGQTWRRGAIHRRRFCSMGHSLRELGGQLLYRGKIRSRGGFGMFTPDRRSRSKCHWIGRRSDSNGTWSQSRSNGQSSRNGSFSQGATLRRTASRYKWDSGRRLRPVWRGCQLTLWRRQKARGLSADFAWSPARRGSARSWRRGAWLGRNVVRTESAGDDDALRMIPIKVPRHISQRAAAEPEASRRARATTRPRGATRQCLRTRGRETPHVQRAGEGERLVIPPFAVRPAFSRHDAQVKGHAKSMPRRPRRPMPTPVPSAPSVWACAGSTPRCEGDL